MTTPFLVLGFLFFIMVIFAIWKGRNVKTMMKVFGASFSFEAQKDDDRKS